MGTIQRIGNFIKSHYPRLIFGIQMSFLIYLFLGLGILSIKAGDILVEWIFWVTIGVFLLFLSIYGLLKLNPRKIWVRIIHIFLDFLFLLLGVLYIFMCLGTIFIFQTILGFFFVVLSLISILGSIIPRLNKRLNEGLFKQPTSARMKHIILFATALLLANGIALFYGYGYDIVLNPAENNIHISFWTGWNADAYNHTLLARLQSYNCSLYLFVPETIIDDNPNEFNSSLVRFANYSINVYITIGAYGDYIAIYNSKQYQTKVLEIAQWIKTNNHSNVKGFAADVEWPYSLISERDKAQDLLGYLQFGRYIFSQVNYTAYHQAVLDYNKTNEELHKLGFESHMVGMIWDMDDYADGDPAIQNIMQFAAVPPHNYDVYNYMVYRALDDNGVNYPGSYFTYYYVNQMINRFGRDTISVSLGVTGVGVYRDFYQVTQDVRICKALGVKEVVIFLLAGSVGLTEAYGNGIDAIDDLFYEINLPTKVHVSYDRLMSIEPKLMNLIDLLI